MKFETCYGTENIPSIEKSDGKAKCPFCNKKHKKNSDTIYVAFNSGPTGRVFYCIKHANKLALEILDLIDQ